MLENNQQSVGCDWLRLDLLDAKSSHSRVTSSELSTIATSAKTPFGDHRILEVLGSKRGTRVRPAVAAGSPKATVLGLMARERGADADTRDVPGVANLSLWRCASLGRVRGLNECYQIEYFLDRVGVQQAGWHGRHFRDSLFFD